jgi:hypothetical protein
MKRIGLILCLSVLPSGAFAQGLIDFANSPTTLVSTPIGGNVVTLPAPVGTYLFGLLTSPTPTGPFSFSGLYATNLMNSSGGRFSGGNGVAVNGWAPGTTMFYEIFGWASSEGTTYSPAWVRADGAPSFLLPGPFGISAIGSGVAGGGPQSLPPLPLFGGVSGITSGFVVGILIPEPSSITLAGLAAAVVLIFRRRVRPHPQALPSQGSC